MEVDEDDDVGGQKTKKSSTSISTSSSRKTNTSTTVKSSSDSTKESSKSVVENDDDSNLFTKSEPVRGYKVVNGKKTSYFHNELDEKSKALIGDIAPKKIENLHPNPAPGIQNSKIGNVGMESKWCHVGRERCNEVGKRISYAAPSTSNVYIAIQLASSF